MEVGLREVFSELITHIDLPKKITVGFRTMRPSDLSGNRILTTVMASLQHVLRRIDVDCVTLAIAGIQRSSFALKGPRAPWK